MSVLSVREIWQGRDGDDEAENRRYTRVFRVMTSSNYDTAAAVLADIRVPRISELFPADIGAWCQKRAARQESFSPRVWIVTCSYSSERELEENPLDDPAEIIWDGEEYMRPVVFDRNGDPVLNSAGDPFDPPVEEEDEWTVVEIVKKLPAVPEWIMGYRKAINSDAFTLDGRSVDIGQAKVKRIRLGKWEERNDIPFRSLTLLLHLRDDGWDEPVLDRGYRQKKPGDSTKRVAMVNDDGTTPSQPILLDGSGSQLANPSPSTAVHLDFELKKQLPFSVLPLS